MRNTYNSIVKHIFSKWLRSLLKSGIQDCFINSTISYQHDIFNSWSEINVGILYGGILVFILSMHVIFLELTTWVSQHSPIRLNYSNGGMFHNVDTFHRTVNDKIQKWIRKWRIKLTESIYINFTYRRLEEVPSINLNGVMVPYANTAKYLGMILELKLKWKEQVKKKREELGIRFCQMN